LAAWRTSGVRRMNKVNARRAWLVLGWVHDRLRAGIPSRYVTILLGQLSLASEHVSTNADSPCTSTYMLVQNAPRNHGVFILALIKKKFLEQHYSKIRSGSNLIFENSNVVNLFSCRSSRSHGCRGRSSRRIGRRRSRVVVVVRSVRQRQSCQSCDYKACDLVLSQILGVVRGSL